MGPGGNYIYYLGCRGGNRLSEVKWLGWGCMANAGGARAPARPAGFRSHVLFGSFELLRASLALGRPLGLQISAQCPVASPASYPPWCRFFWPLCALFYITSQGLRIHVDFCDDLIEVCFPISYKFHESRGWGSFAIAVSLVLSMAPGTVVLDK